MHTAIEIREYFKNSRNPGIVLRELIAGARSRVEVANRTGLDRATVTNAVNRLLADGLIVESETVYRQVTGRPRKKLRPHDDAFHIVGVHVGVTAVTAVMCGIGGSIIQRNVALHDATVDGVISVITDLVTMVRQASAVTPLGVGVTIGGSVDATTGMVFVVPAFGWADVDLGSRLEDSLGLPVRVTSAAIGHAQSDVLFGVVDSSATFGHLYVGSIVEYAFAHEGEIWRGHHRAGGLIEKLPLAVDGGFATVHDVISDRGVVVQARRADLLGDDADFEKYLELVAAGGPRAARLQDLLDQRARHVGDLIAQLQEVVAVPTVVLSASMVRQRSGIEIAAAQLEAVCDDPPKLVSGGDEVTSSARASAAVFIRTLWH